MFVFVQFKRPICFSIVVHLPHFEFGTCSSIFCHSKLARFFWCVCIAWRTHFNASAHFLQWDLIIQKWITSVDNSAIAIFYCCYQVQVVTAINLNELEPVTVHTENHNVKSEKKCRTYSTYRTEPHLVSNVLLKNINNQRNYSIEQNQFELISRVCIDMSISRHLNHACYRIQSCYKARDQMLVKSEERNINFSRDRTKKKRQKILVPLSQMKLIEILT